MTKIAICGACGKMGRFVAASVAAREDCQTVAGIDLCKDDTLGFPVYEKLADMREKPDVIIDFSHPSCLAGILDYAVSTGTPAVLCSTGYSAEQLADIQNASAQTALFASGNMSLGIQLLIALSRKAAAVLGTQFDIEIIERHHNQKIDAPSGTALMLANALCEEFEGGKTLVYDRHSVRKKRDISEIGMHSVRGGTIVGEHEVLFAGNDECISLKHTASSKRVFAEGAVNAALFLVGKSPKMYDMTDLLDAES